MSEPMVMSEADRNSWVSVLRECCEEAYHEWRSAPEASKAKARERLDDMRAGHAEFVAAHTTPATNEAVRPAPAPLKHAAK